MKTEIERKYLVAGNAWRNEQQRVFIRQGYLSLDRERTVRVRLADDRGFLTIKGSATGITRPEYEYTIPSEDARFLIEHLCLKPLIEKYRYTVEYAGAQWSVDEFLGVNAGLVVAEIELKTEDQDITLPDWVVEDVTNDPKYLNVQLTQNPYLDWHA
ncbi:MAG: CYTH domain-containing protein [Fidelibacterota bacterium]